PLAPVLARARVLGGGATALPLTGVDAGAVHHVAALLPPARARRESARHDEARRRARDQYPFVHSHSLLLGLPCHPPFGLPISRERGPSIVPTAPRADLDLPAAPRSNTVATRSLPASGSSLSGVIGPPGEMPGTGYRLRPVPPLIVQGPGRAQRTTRRAQTRPPRHAPCWVRFVAVAPASRARSRGRRGEKMTLGTDSAPRPDSRPDIRETDREA